MDSRYTPEGIRRDLEYTDASGESREQWWDRAHRTGHEFWLSGTPGPEVWARLGIEDRLAPGTAVLNVGIGLGRCTRELAARGLSVHGLDISQRALDRVADVATGWRADRLSDLPDGAFDLALSHLVAQHMFDADLGDQISAVVRSLKPKGIFAMQYATAASGPTEQTLQNLKGGSIFRTVSLLNALVDQAGGTVTQTLDRESHPCGTIWKVAHIRRQTA